MKYFQTDGIRGKVNTYLSIDLLTKLGCALSSLPFINIYIGYDTRYSSSFIKSALSAALLSGSRNVYDVGIVSTPSLALYSYLSRSLCIMITASHNSFEDNGIKIIKCGEKLTAEEEYQIEYHMDHLYKENKLNKIGTYYTNKDIVFETYYKYLSSLNFSYKDKVVFDCANGSLYSFINKVKDFIPNLIITSIHPTGYNIGEKCGSESPYILQQYLIKNHLPLGCASDGDSDRLIVVTPNKILYGDDLIYIFAKYLKSKNRLKNNKVVMSCLANKGVIKALESENIEVVLSPVGDKNIKRIMDKQELILGGEPSGHIILKEYLPTGDFLTNALFLLQIMDDYAKENNQFVIEDLVKYTRFDEFSVNIPSKRDKVNNKLIYAIYTKYYDMYADKVFINIRNSGTEDVTRIKVQSSDKTIDVKELISSIKTDLLKELL